MIAKIPPDTQPTPHRFPIRNRMIASLTTVVVVAEAAFRSWSLITAKGDANRGSDFIAVMESPLDPLSDGYGQPIHGVTTLVRHTAGVI